MDPLKKLQELYNERDALTKKIDAIGEALGLTKEPEVPVVVKRKRGPNRPKVQPQEAVVE